MVMPWKEVYPALIRLCPKAKERHLRIFYQFAMYNAGGFTAPGHISVDCQNKMSVDRRVYDNISAFVT